MSIKSKNNISGLFYLLFLASIPLVFFNRVNILDWYRLRGYQAPQSISDLADSTSMTDYARRLFYVNHPSLDPKSTFRSNCLGVEKSIVLGCYISNKGIFILDVQDYRLNGIEEVTSAHEMLHVAYERLSSKERQSIDKLLNGVLKNSTNERIINIIAKYREQDPTIVENELHSIIATEVRDIPLELENYYKKYFYDRNKVIELSERYEATFTAIKNQVQVYDGQIQILKAKIDTNRQTLEVKEKEINQLKQEMNQMLAQNRTQEYNQSVPVYNALVQSYNKLAKETQSLIKEHNNLIEKRNELAFEERELIEAIDSRID